MYLRLFLVLFFLLNSSGCRNGPPHISNIMHGLVDVLLQISAVFVDVSDSKVRPIPIRVISVSQDNHAIVYGRQFALVKSDGAHISVLAWV